MVYFKSFLGFVFKALQLLPKPTHHVLPQLHNTPQKQVSWATSHLEKVSLSHFYGYEFPVPATIPSWEHQDMRWGTNSPVP